MFFWDLLFALLSLFPHVLILLLPSLVPYGVGFLELFNDLQLDVIFISKNLVYISLVVVLFTVASLAGQW